MFRRTILGFAAVTVLLLSPVEGFGAEPASPEWDSLVKAARSEGKVELILSGQGPSMLRKVMPEFEKKYGVRVIFQTGNGAEHNERILAERRLNRFTVDVWMGGINPPLSNLYPINGLSPLDELLIAPEVKDASLWYEGRHHYADPEGRYILSWGASPSDYVVFNTKLVDPKDIQSYWDLLDPKWKGKIVSWSPASQGATTGTIPMFLNPQVGEKWFRRWATEMDVTIVKDARQGAEWVALGRFPIGMFGLGTQARQLAQQGFPIQEYLPHGLAEGDVISPSASNIMVLNRAPNPNAAKLFVNWALSKETQQKFIQTTQRMDSLRNDVDNTVIEEQYRVDRSRSYFSTFSRSNPNYANVDRQIAVTKTLQKIMQDAGYQ